MSNLARLSSLVGALIISASVLPSSLNAQQGTVVDRDSTAASAAVIRMSTRVTIVDSALATGPRVVRAGINVERLPEVAPTQGSRGAHVGAGTNVAMMGVGAAGIVVGSMIGGDGGMMIAIGGGVVGLIGLYRFLR